MPKGNAAAYGVVGMAKSLLEKVVDMTGSTRIVSSGKSSVFTSRRPYQQDPLLQRSLLDVERKPTNILERSFYETEQTARDMQGYLGARAEKFTQPLGNYPAARRKQIENAPDFDVSAGTGVPRAASPSPAAASPSPAGAAGGGQTAPGAAANNPRSSNMMNALSIAGTAGGMALAGGTASYMTGGEFGQGAVVGGMVGFGGVSAARFFSATTPTGMKSVLGEGMGGSLASMTESARPVMAEALGDTVTRRGAMVAGAGLGGFIFGGRRNHRRGFNSRRGNRI